MTSTMILALYLEVEDSMALDAKAEAYSTKNYILVM